jgi:BMFP domain-containing protein YqiC
VPAPLEEGHLLRPQSWEGDSPPSRQATSGLRKDESGRATAGRVPFLPRLILGIRLLIKHVLTIIMGDHAIKSESEERMPQDHINGIVFTNMDIIMREQLALLATRQQVRTLVDRVNALEKAFETLLNNAEEKGLNLHGGDGEWY